MENILPTIKKTATIEKSKQSAANEFNETNPYDRNKTDTLNEDSKNIDYITGLKKSMSDLRKEQSSFNRYNKNNEYKPID